MSWAASTNASMHRGRRGRHCGRGQADRRRRGARCASAGADGQCRGAARAAAGVEIAVLAHLGIGGGDGGAGHPQRVGQRALAGQPGADGQASVDDQQPDRVGQARGRPGRCDWTCASCPVRGPKGPHRALARAFQSSFACQYALNWLLKSKPVGRTMGHEHELDISTGPHVGRIFEPAERIPRRFSRPRRRAGAPASSTPIRIRFPHHA